MTAKKVKVQVYIPKKLYDRFERMRAGWVGGITKSRLIEMALRTELERLGDKKAKLI